MKLPAPFVKLPLQFEAARLESEVKQFAEDQWRAHPQGYAGNSALILVSRDGRDNDETSGAMAATDRLGHCPYIQQIMASFETVIGRSRLMRLAPGAEVQTHADLGYYWHDHVRIHVPVVTASTVRFHCGDQDVHMRAGESWIFDNWRPHRVINASALTRIHLVIDTVGSARFWRLASEGAAPNNRASNKTIAYDAGAVSQPPIERCNVEPVASPATVKAIVQELVNELRASRPRRQQHAELEALLIDCARDWQALWALHGANASGWTQFLGLRDSVLAQALVRGRNIRLPSNGAAATDVLRSFLGAWLNIPQTPAAPTPAAPQTPAPRFERPIIIVSAPRSGSTLLYELLAHHPQLWTLGGESHGEIENIPGLAPAERHYQSNALGTEDADAETYQRLINLFTRQLRDNQSRPYAAYPAEIRPASIRFLEKTPKNALRVPFLQAVFPNALFIFLYRKPRSNLASMIDAWHSGRFVTYRDLPGWPGPPWSLLLPPGWQRFKGKALSEVVAFQWKAANTAIMNSLAVLPRERWRTLDYSALVQQPAAALARILDFADLEANSDLEHRARAGLPLSRYTLTPPAADKWKRHATALTDVLAESEALYEKLNAFANPLP